MKAGAGTPAISRSSSKSWIEVMIKLDEGTKGPKLQVLITVQFISLFAITSHSIGSRIVFDSSLAGWFVDSVESL